MNHESHTTQPDVIDLTHHEEPTVRDYGIFGLIIVGILVIATVIENLEPPVELLGWLRNVMGVFFVVFAGFKFLDLKGFAYSFANYDLVARRWLSWGYLYPFIELGLGLLFLFSVQLTVVNWVTLVLMSVGAVGVGGELLRGSKIKCACLGTFVKLPLSTVSLTEDLTMGLMALVTLLASGSVY